MIYNFYIFDRHCACLYYAEWARRKKAAMSDDEERKLVYGLLFSIKNVCDKLSDNANGDTFLGYRTNAYKLHYYETPSGLKFVLTTDAAAASMRETLQRIYSQFYVEYVAKNPLARLDATIDNEGFVKNLDRYVRSLPNFQ